MNKLTSFFSGHVLKSFLPRIMSCCYLFQVVYAPLSDLITPKEGQHPSSTLSFSPLPSPITTFFAREVLTTEKKKDIKNQRTQYIRWKMWTFNKLCDNLYQLNHLGHKFSTLIQVQKQKILEVVKNVVNRNSRILKLLQLSHTICTHVMQIIKFGLILLSLHFGAKMFINKNAKLWESVI